MLINGYFCPFVFGDFFLPDCVGDFVWSIVLDKTRIAAAVEEILSAKVVNIAEPSSVADNADMNAL